VEEELNAPPETILVVDDNQDGRELVVKILKKEGYNTVEAVDGEDALAKALTDHPVLILMDISLPKMDGFDVTRNLKAREEFKHVPIVALTAHAMKGDEERVLKAGFDGYIPKPINVRELPGHIEYYRKKMGFLRWPRTRS